MEGVLHRLSLYLPFQSYRQPNQNWEPSDNEGKWVQLAPGYVSIGMKQTLYFPTGQLVKS